MKLGKTSLLLLSIGVFVITFGSIGMIHSQQLSAKETLDKDLAQAQLRLSKVQVDDLARKKADLEKQISGTKLDIKAAKESMVQDINSIDLSNAVLTIASNSRVTITEIRSSGAASTSLEGLSFSTITVSVSVEGEVADIIRFVGNLQNDITNALVKSANIQYPPVDKPDQPPVGSVQLMVYSYQGG